MGIVQLPAVAAAFVSLERRNRRLPGAGRRLRLQPAEVQPRHAGLAPARFVDQAVRVFGGAGKRLLAADHHARRAARPAGAKPATSLEPQNDDGKFDGPITHARRAGEIEERRLGAPAAAITVPYAHDFLGKFGFDLARHPKNLTLALGTGAVTPLQLAGAYAVFANGGYSPSSRI
jgi:penicillin-binding protein 1A